MLSAENTFLLRHYVNGRRRPCDRRRADRLGASRRSTEKFWLRITAPIRWRYLILDCDRLRRENNRKKTGITRPCLARVGRIQASSNAYLQPQKETRGPLESRSTPQRVLSLSHADRCSENFERYETNCAVRFFVFFENKNLE
jgi:hypothetical protein